MDSNHRPPAYETSELPLLHPYYISYIMNILFKTQFGSHLYGTNGPNSDLDYKGIFMATLPEIVLKKDKHVVIQNVKTTDGDRNSAGDVDTELKELREFLKEAMEGQTYALDMLFSTSNFWLQTSPEWKFIIENRTKLLSKNVKPFLGYIRQQTAKYGLKGARLAELHRIIEYYDKFSPNSLISDHPLPSLSEFVRIWEQICERPHGLDNINVTYLEVLGKKFQMNTHLKNVLYPLKKLDEEYGKRSRLAANNEGVDWKAVSHAFRLSYQLVDLAENHQFVFPLKQVNRIKQIKNGELPWLQLQDELSELMDKSFQAIEKSTLPEEPDRVFWSDFIVWTYLKSITS